MDVNKLLIRVRRGAGLSQSALAMASGTSRPTLSAYENGRKSPSLATAARIVEAAGFVLTVVRGLTFATVQVGRGRPVTVPSGLPRLELGRAFAVVELPVHLNWSDRGRQFDLRVRQERARVYEIVLREGGADDLLQYVDGALLVDLWDELVLPAPVRAAWQSVLAGHAVAAAT